MDQGLGPNKETQLIIVSELLVSYFQVAAPDQYNFEKLFHLVAVENVINHPSNVNANM